MKRFLASLAFVVVAALSGCQTPAGPEPYLTKPRSVVVIETGTDRKELARYTVPATSIRQNPDGSLTLPGVDHPIRTSKTIPVEIDDDP